MKNKMNVEEINHHIYRRNNKIKNKKEISNEQNHARELGKSF